MLVARAILRSAAERWREILEPHDSFFIGSDVFYSYLVGNGCWRTRQKQRDEAQFLDGVEQAQEQMLAGAFPEFVRDQFAEMLDYFGQAPIVVRSSSLLEDSFGNAFSGQVREHLLRQPGLAAGPAGRLSGGGAPNLRERHGARGPALSRAARSARSRRTDGAAGAARLRGGARPSLLPAGGRGGTVSFNPFVWSEQIDPKAGVLRLVFGLGTRAVRRSDDDYTRIVGPQRARAPGRRRRRARCADMRNGAWMFSIWRRTNRGPRPFEEVVTSCGREGHRNGRQA